ncbi:hypothetical protein [Marinilabilia salmonicolor]|uniref:hypothetical protein n=1 Tax=Marinilabilia salmonicolor TaxID=989 RepID=UPI001F2569BA|nr:hypothetical protein [Marinilabilia salmonicolor]
MKNILLTIRRLKKNKTAALLGISGLIVGLICVMFIFFWIIDEVSYDRFHDKIDRTFVVHAFLEGGQEKVSFDGCPPAVGPQSGMNIRKSWPSAVTGHRLMNTFWSLEKPNIWRRWHLPIIPCLILCLSLL